MVTTTRFEQQIKYFTQRPNKPRFYLEDVKNEGEAIATAQTMWLISRGADDEIALFRENEKGQVKEIRII